LAFIGIKERKKKCKEKEVDKIAEQRLHTPQEEISVCLPCWRQSSTLWCWLSTTDWTLPCWTYICCSQLSHLNRYYL